MPNKYKYTPAPNDPTRPTSVRGAYLYNLVDALHACLVRGELDRAARAWAILVRCPDVNWRERWHWGLYLLTAGSGAQGPGGTQTGGSTYAHSQTQTWTQTQTQTQGSQPQQSQSLSQFPDTRPERWLKSLQVSSSEADKPAVLAELVLQLISEGKYKAALDELETYLPSYPYLLSAPLHTYAGLVCFYLAQPLSARAEGREDERERKRRRRREMSLVSSAASIGTDDTDSTDSTRDPPNAALMRQARAYFAKALSVDPTEPVAREFVEMMDRPDDKSDESDLAELDDKSDTKSDWDKSESKSEPKSDDDMFSLRSTPRTRTQSVASYDSLDEVMYASSE